MEKENLTNKPKNKSFLPKNIEDKKILYRYLRTLELKIRHQLEKDNKLELSLTSSENESEEDNSNNISGINFFSFYPIKEEKNEKIKMEEKNKKNKKKKLIFDNLYLYKKDENENKNIEIKKEVYDILNQKNDENKDDDNKNNQRELYSPTRGNRGKFNIRRRKFSKKTTIVKLKKLEDEKMIVLKKEENNDDKERLERRIAKFYEKIRKLKTGEIDISDYEEELSELMTEQIDKINYEEDKLRELRLFSFVKNFQANRKNEMFGKNYYRKRLVFNSPINFTFYPKMSKIKSADSLNE